MKTKLNVLTAALIGAQLLTSNSFAQNSTGNGGDAIVCGDTAVMLDYYEGKQKGYFYNLLSSQKSVTENITVVLENMKKRDLSAPQFIEGTAFQIAKDFELILTQTDSSGTKYAYGLTDDLIDIDDSKEVFVPATCRKVQVAVQTETIITGQKFIAIHTPTLRMMNSVQKAVLAIHEALYNSAKGQNSDSKTTRMLNSFISSVDLNTVKYLDYLKALESSRVFPYSDLFKPYHTLDGIKFDLKNIYNETNDKISVSFPKLPRAQSQGFDSAVFQNGKLIAGWAERLLTIDEHLGYLNNLDTLTRFLKYSRRGDAKRQIKRTELVLLEKFTVNTAGNLVFDTKRLRWIAPFDASMGDGGISGRDINYIEHYATVIVDRTGKVLQAIRQN